MFIEKIRTFWPNVIPFLASISVEPVFFLDGFAYSNMVVLVESLQFDKICQVNLNYTDKICENFDEYPTEEHEYNTKVSSFKRNDGAITSVIPVFFILFIGAWSDKYGRKFPLCLTLFCHILFSGGYLINSIFFSIPVNYLLIIGFLDSIGGGSVAFLTVSNAYVSDVTTTEQRTSRVALSNSLWFLGGPLGTLVGTEIYKAAGYPAVFGTSLVLYLVAFVYVATMLPESHGPFADKERLKKIAKPRPTLRLRDTIIRVYGLSKKKKKNAVNKTESEEERIYKKSLTWRKMTADFFDIKRVFLSFKCVLKKREGHTRIFIFLLILSNFLRKIGRGAYAFYFTKEVLKWGATDYGYFSTYKNFLSTMGSLLAVPILSLRLSVSDNALAMIGSLSSIADYVLYGLVTPALQFLMWMAPVSSILINSCSIAMRSMLSKYVGSDELGQVSAVTGTLEGIVPIVSTSMYSAITKATFESFPGAQYFFGAGCNLLMAFLFIIIIVMDRSRGYNLEMAKPSVETGPVVEKTIVIRSDSNWVDEDPKKKLRLSTILLSSLNFSIEIPTIEKLPKKKISTISDCFGKSRDNRTKFEKNTKRSKICIVDFDLHDCNENISCKKSLAIESCCKMSHNNGNISCKKSPDIENVRKKSYNNENISCKKSFEIENEWKKSHTNESTLCKMSHTNENGCKKSIYNEDVSCKMSPTSENGCRKSPNGNILCKKSHTNDYDFKKPISDKNVLCKRFYAMENSYNKSIKNENPCKIMLNNENLSTKSPTSENISCEKSPRKNISCEKSPTSENISCEKSPTSENISCEKSPTSENISCEKSLTSKNISCKKSPTSENISCKKSPTSENISCKKSPTSENISCKMSPTSENISCKGLSTNENTCKKSSLISNNIIYKNTVRENIQPSNCVSCLKKVKLDLRSKSTSRNENKTHTENLDEKLGPKASSTFENLAFVEDEKL